MNKQIQITVPLEESAARSLKAGDNVLITGKMIVARDAAHKRMIEALEKGGELPLDIKGAVVYYMGPSPARPGQAIGAAGPTTSSRMDKYTPQLIEQGLKGMVGKGERSEEVVKAMQRHGCVYMAAIGGAGALASKRIKSYTVMAYEDLGPEALSIVEVENFPVVVVIDCEGTNYYQKGQAEYRED
jgi:fumarate hydratase subunit beta